MGLAKVSVISKPFTNKYMSVSRIKQYEKCPLAFKFGYIDRRARESGEAAAFGSMVHKAMELIYRWIVDEEFEGTVPDEVIIRQYRNAFEESEVVGEAAYKHGILLVREYFRFHDHVSHETVLGIERKFSIIVEADDESRRYEVFGIIDRIERLDKTSVLVVDYKTNKSLFTREELDSDLQMSVYGIAVKTLWPWVQNVQFAFDMVRHSTRQYTRRSDADMNEAGDYIIAIAGRIESSLQFPAKLNTLCPWCDHREACPTYQEALQKGETTLSYLVAADDIKRVAAERDRCNALEMIAKKRREEMDKILIEHMSQSDNEERLVIGDMSYTLTQKVDTTWPMEKAVTILAEALDVPEEKVRSWILVPQKGLIEKAIKAAKLRPSQAQLLRAKLDAVAERNPSRSFINARAVHQRKGKK